MRVRSPRSRSRRTWPRRRRLSAPSWPRCTNCSGTPAQPGARSAARRPAEFTEARIAQLAAVIDAPRTLALWRELLSAGWPGPPYAARRPAPANLMVDSGRLSAVIDFGDITSATRPPTWPSHGCCSRPRPGPAFETRSATSMTTRGREPRLGALPGRGLLANSADNPVITQIGEQTLAAVLASQRDL